MGGRFLYSSSVPIAYRWRRTSFIRSAASSCIERSTACVATRIECSDYFEVRDRALLAHATQVDPDGFWFQVPRQLQQRVWPVEEFELALSYVPVDLPEDDLFAGLGSAAEADAAAGSGPLEITYDGRLAPDDEEKFDPAERVEHPNEQAEGNED